MESIARTTKPPLITAEHFVTQGAGIDGLLGVGTNAEAKRHPKQANTIHGCVLPIFKTFTLHEGYFATDETRMKPSAGFARQPIYLTTKGTKDTKKLSMACLTFVIFVTFVV